MMPQVYLAIGTVILLLTVGRVVWRKGTKSIDWDLIVAFVRLDFPPEQRDIAQKIAAGLAQIVGLKIKELRPEHTLKQIADWAGAAIQPSQLVRLFYVSYNVECQADTTYRRLVEKVTEALTEKARRAS
jgi:hypothetical protein